MFHRVGMCVGHSTLIATFASFDCFVAAVVFFFSLSFHNIVKIQNTLDCICSCVRIEITAKQAKLKQTLQIKKKKKWSFHFRL